MYSKKLDGGLCLACVLFSKRQPDHILVGKAMTKYNKATDYLKDLAQDFDINYRLVFDTEEEKEEFMESMDTVRKILSSSNSIIWHFFGLC